MEKFAVQVCEDIPAQIVKIVEDIMPMGHIGVCYLSKDKQLAQKAVSAVKESEYKITYIEFPDGSVSDEETIKEIVNSADDIRLFVGAGGREIAGILGKACETRQCGYALTTASPFIYGVGYAFEKGCRAPIKLIIDAEELNRADDYGQCVGAILAHRLALWEKKYVSQMLGVYDGGKLKARQILLDGIIGEGDMSDKAKVFDGLLRFAKAYESDFLSSVEIVARLIEYSALTNVRGESLLIAAIALIKYFKAIMSIKEYRLLIPSDMSARCLTLSKLSGIDVSEIIQAIRGRQFQNKWLYIHAEYREDMLKELEEIESKLVKIIKSAKRFMPDVGYHLSEDYDSSVILRILYNVSPLTHECSPLSMAEYLGIVKD